MSRLAKKPIVVGKDISASFKDGVIELKNSKGALKYSFEPDFKVEISDVAGVKNIKINRSGDSKKSKALHGLYVALVKNAVKGLSDGFSKELEIHGVGFKAAVEGSKMNMALGFTHPVKIDIPEGIKVAVDQKATLITISGIDKGKVGQFCADIRAIRPPEPYKGTGIRYKGERIIKKAGKAAAGAATGGK